MKELSMTTTETKFYSTRMECPNKILNNIVLGSTFGSISASNASKDSEMMKEDFSMCIETCLRKLRENNSRPTNREMIYKRK